MSLHFKKMVNFKSQPKPIRPLMVWGKHVVLSCLKKLGVREKFELIHGNMEKRKIYSEYVLHILSEKSGKIPSQLESACDLAKNAGVKITIHRLEKSWPLVDVRETIVHQRICLQIPAYPTEDIYIACEIVKKHKESQEFGCVGIILDQIQDPHNFGAILRSAAFFNIKFVVYAKDRQADISSIVLKASAGGAFDLHLISVVNIVNALDQLKHSGAWILGTANTEDAIPLRDVPSDRVWVCVLGNEGEGLRAKVFENCDFITKILGGTQNVDSLNVSVAAGILMQNLQEHKKCLD